MHRGIEKTVHCDISEGHGKQISGEYLNEVLGMVSGVKLKIIEKSNLRLLSYTYVGVGSNETCI